MSCFKMKGSINDSEVFKQYRITKRTLQNVLKGMDNGEQGEMQ